MENMEGALPNNGTTTLNGNKGEELEPPKKKAKHVAEKNPAKKDLAALPVSVENTVDFHRNNASLFSPLC